MIRIHPYIFPACIIPNCRCMNSRIKTLCLLSMHLINKFQNLSQKAKQTGWFQPSIYIVFFRQDKNKIAMSLATFLPASLCLYMYLVFSLYWCNTFMVRQPRSCQDSQFYILFFDKPPRGRYTCTKCTIFQLTDKCSS